jgi:hypothetical protein
MPDQQFFGLPMMNQVIGTNVVGHEQQFNAGGWKIAAQTDEQFGLVKFLAVVNVLQPHLLGAGHIPRLQGLIDRKVLDQSVESLQQHLSVHVEHGRDFDAGSLAQLAHHTLPTGVEQSLIVGDHQYRTALVRERMKQALQGRQLARLSVQRVVQVFVHPSSFHCVNWSPLPSKSKKQTISKWYKHHIRHFVVSSMVYNQ